MDKIIKTWNAATKQWETMAMIRGERGPAGPTGADGATGETGPTGHRGPSAVLGTYNAVIGTAWTGTAAPYTQDVALADVTADCRVQVRMPVAATAEQVAAYQALNPQDGGQAAGKFTVRAFGTKNTIPIPISVTLEVVGA